jgi:xanthine dehydrogenase accessory factor
VNEWVEHLVDLTAAGEPVVIVTVAGVRGSAPREIGAKMLVTASETIGTIGGGQLEYQCTRLAVERLDRDSSIELERFPLGAAMGQCCGGVVEILFETVADGLPAWLRTLGGLHGQRTPAMLVTDLDGGAADKLIVTADSEFGDTFGEDVSAARERLDARAPARLIERVFYEPVLGSDFDVAVFGAGHVGSALVGVLATLDCNVRWIDSRRNVFRHVPNNARAIETREPALEVAALAPGAHVLVMTHSHAIDFDICTKALRRDDLAYVGLIGSAAKRRRFEKRFREQGLGDAEIARLTCPIGVDGITGKKPAEIAVAASAELLRLRGGSARATLPDNVTRLGS